MIDHFEMMKNIAEDISPVSSARICAIIVKKNKIISIGVNQAKTHPLQAKYGKNEDAIYMHAEISAISTALRKISREELAKCHILICRRKYGVDGKFINGLAKPCMGCIGALKAFGIKVATYTLDGDEGFGKMDIQ